MTSELPDGYEISSDPARLDRALVHRWLSEDAYWALGRPRETQDRAIAHSLNFGVYDTATTTQVGYARVVTDRTTFAWLCDVYIAPAARGRGLGKALAGAVRDHLAPFGLRRIMLATHDAHGVYAKVGFEPLATPEKWMVLGASEDQLLTRAQRLWAGLAKVPSDYPAENPTVLVSPDSGLCPPGWVGVVLLGGAALVTAPTEPVAERLRQAAGRLTPQALADPQALGAVLRPTEVLGPATLAYLAPEEFGPAHEHRAEELAPDHPALCALRDRATPAEADETDLADLTFAVLDDGRALAAAGYHRWPGGAAQLNVFTDPDHRSRGLARSAASAAVAHALAAGLLPQWRARPPASRRVAAALGFRELGAQLSLRLA